MTLIAKKNEEHGMTLKTGIAKTTPSMEAYEGRVEADEEKAS